MCIRDSTNNAHISRTTTRTPKTFHRYVPRVHADIFSVEKINVFRFYCPKVEFYAFSGTSSYILTKMRHAACSRTSIITLRACRIPPCIATRASYSSWHCNLRVVLLASQLARRTASGIATRVSYSSLPCNSCVVQLLALQLACRTAPRIATRSYIPYPCSLG